ncbi:MAG: hypothetical protein F6J87_01995 [Spirulina sp. SIO3F2]|nr:hypothetical protein [Spirulina sp. SIO3F2]
MEQWQTLVATALMGTGRQAPTPPTGEGALATTLSQLDWSQPEQAILGAAGAIALHQAVGQQPQQQDWQPIEPGSTEHFPIIAPSIARHLETAIDNDPELLPELLTLIAQTQQRIPERLLPRLLNLGQRHTELRHHITPVIGQRGQWLATRKENWRYGRVGDIQSFNPNAPEAQELWHNGRQSERLLFFQRWREVDPDGARAALATIWPKAAAREREGLTQILETSLSMADEPFLEAALDDRAPSVRKAVVQLLIKLPESRLCQRMATRLHQLQASDQQGLLSVSAPKTYEPDWERDGLPKRVPAKRGEQGWWLEQMVAAAPLDIWGDPARAMAAIAKGRWQHELRAGWELAAQRQKRADWADVILTQINWPIAGGNQQKRRTIRQLLALLTPSRREHHLQAQLSNNAFHGDWLELMSECANQWTLAFSQVVLEQLTKIMIQRGSTRYSAVRSFLDHFRLTLHPDLAPEVAQAVAELPAKTNSMHLFERHCFKLIETLTIRREFWQHFQVGLDIEEKS